MESSTTDGRLIDEAPARGTMLSGMACVDTARNPRIPILMEMVGALSRATSPHEVLRDFSKGIVKLQGMRGYISLSTRGLEPGEYRITRLITDDRIDDIDISDPWQSSQSLPVHSGGFLGEIIRQAYPEIIHHLSVPDDPVLGDALTDFGSLMAIPLFDNGEPLNWAIMLRRDPEGYTVEELEESILRANLVGTTVRNVLVAQKLRDANERAQREVEQIARIQRTLLPERMPSIPGLSLAASYETFDQAGGDLYLLRPLRPMDRPGQPDDPCCERRVQAIGLRGTGSSACCDPAGPWGVLVADASGHGPAAAVVMAMMHAIIEAYPHEPEGPAEVLEHANRHLFAKRIEHSFVTAVFGIYEPASRRFTYARAGHNPPIQMRRGDDGWIMRRLDEVGGVPLGIMADVHYEQATLQLAPGQSLVLYTDGITESMSPDGEMFGVAGIERSLTECTGEPDCVIGHVTGALKVHEATVRPNDDQTLVVIRIDPDGQPTTADA